VVRGHVISCPPAAKSFAQCSAQAMLMAMLGRKTVTLLACRVCEVDASRCQVASMQVAEVDEQSQLQVCNEKSRRSLETCSS